jgi:ubiquinone/menaquinone biosynthesis C-methylase UbiE
MKTKKKKLPNERMDMVLDVRAKDRRKLVATYLELSVTNFEEVSKELLPRLINLIMGGAEHVDDAAQTIKQFLQHLDEYVHDMEQLKELIHDYIKYEDAPIVVSLPMNTPISQDELSEHISQSYEKQEGDAKIKKKINKKNATKVKKAKGSKK